MAYKARPNPAKTPITVHSGNGPTSQSMPAPTPRPTATPARSKKATDSADADEPLLPSPRLSSGGRGVTVTLYLPFPGPATHPPFPAGRAQGRFLTTVAS